MANKKQSNKEKIENMKKQQRDLEITIFKLQGAIEMLTSLEEEKENGEDK